MEKEDFIVIELLDKDKNITYSIYYDHYTMTNGVILEEYPIERIIKDLKIKNYQIKEEQVIKEDHLENYKPKILRFPTFDNNYESDFIKYELQTKKKYIRDGLTYYYHKIKDKKDNIEESNTRYINDNRFTLMENETYTLYQILNEYKNFLFLVKNKYNGKNFQEIKDIVNNNSYLLKTTEKIHLGISDDNLKEFLETDKFNFNFIELDISYVGINQKLKIKETEDNLCLVCSDYDKFLLCSIYDEDITMEINHQYELLENNSSKNSNQIKKTSKEFIEEHLALWNDGFYLKENTSYSGREIVDLYIIYCKYMNQKVRKYTDINNIDNSIEIHFKNSIRLKLDIDMYNHPSFGLGVQEKEINNLSYQDVLVNFRTVTTEKDLDGETLSNWNNKNLIPITNTKNKDNCSYNYDYKNKIWTNKFLNRFSNNKISVENIINLYNEYKIKNEVLIPLDNNMTIKLKQNEDFKIENIMIEVYDENNNIIDQFKNHNLVKEDKKNLYNYKTSLKALEIITDAYDRKIETEMKIKEYYNKKQLIKK